MVFKGENVFPEVGDSSWKGKSKVASDITFALTLESSQRLHLKYVTYPVLLNSFSHKHRLNTTLLELRGDSVRQDEQKRSAGKVLFAK